MSFVKIVAPLTGGERDAAVLTSAISAALPFGAHIVALFVRADPALAMPFYAEGASSLVMQEVVDRTREASGEAARAARETVMAVARAADVAAIERPEKRDTPTISFLVVDGSFADCVVRAALLSDLVVFSAPGEDNHLGAAEAIDAVLLEARRPALLSSKPIAPGFQARIAIGWDASAACMQAVCAAMPLIGRAQEVFVYCVRHAENAPARCPELLDYLALHGIKASAVELSADKRTVADTLVEAAAQAGAGVLVLGGYGHSRWRELFVTSTTRQAMSRLEVPLFLMH